MSAGISKFMKKKLIQNLNPCTLHTRSRSDLAKMKRKTSYHLQNEQEIAEEESQ